MVAVGSTPEELAVLLTAEMEKWRPVIKQAHMHVLEAYNRTTMQVCAERRLSCVDLARELPKDAELFYDDFHFSRAGAMRAGSVVARSLGYCQKGVGSTD
jgi:hypothetical protein